MFKDTNSLFKPSLSRSLFTAFIILIGLSSCTTEQINKSLELANQVYGGTPPNNGEISLGLKQALEVGAKAATQQLSSKNGFFGNAAVKLMLPPEVQKAEKRLRELGLGKLADETILSMNRAAENASAKATPILISAIKGMSITDAQNILFGGKNAATSFLKNKTSDQLNTAFLPIITNSTKKVGATKYWNSFANTYNQIPFATPITASIENYITQKTLDGLFHNIALEENKIRENPIKRSTALLKRVFSYADAAK